MTTEQLKEVFDNYEDEFLRFNLVSNPLSTRKDIHAFIRLNTICPSSLDIVSSAEHDEIWLGVDVEHFASVVTKEEVLELVRCGVRFDDSVDALAMFV